jgi:hypothetical protein
LSTKSQITARPINLLQLSKESRTTTITSMETMSNYSTLGTFRMPPFSSSEVKVKLSSLYKGTSRVMVTTRSFAERFGGRKKIQSVSSLQTKKVTTMKTNPKPKDLL